MATGKTLEGTRLARSRPAPSTPGRYRHDHDQRILWFLATSSVAPGLFGTAVIWPFWTTLIGAGNIIATVAGFLISLNYGLFGFQDSLAARNAVGAFVIEIASAVLFIAAVALDHGPGRPFRLGGRAGPALGGRRQV